VTATGKYVTRRRYRVSDATLELFPLSLFQALSRRRLFLALSRLLGGLASLDLLLDLRVRGGDSFLDVWITVSTPQSVSFFEEERRLLGMLDG